MDRKAALVQLQERFEGTRLSLQQEFGEIVTEHFEELIAALYHGVKELDKQYPIRVVQFQLMRADIYSGKCRIRVCGYDENWYLDEQRTETEVEADYLFEPFEGLINTLSGEISVYMGGVTRYDIQNLVCEFFMECFCSMAGRVRERFFLFDEWAEENAIDWKRPYRVVWGEYEGRAETLFYMDRVGKETEDFPRECRKEASLFESFVRSCLTELEISAGKFAYLNMKESRLSRVTFEKCDLGLSMFQDSVMEWCAFTGSRLYGCNFSRIEGYQVDFGQALLSNSSFRQARLRKVKLEGAILEDITFQGAVLEECSLRNTRLRRVDLRACCIQGLDLTGAEMEQVYIRECDMEALQLTEEQSRQVYVLEEEADAIL